MDFFSSYLFIYFLRYLMYFNERRLEMHLSLFLCDLLYDTFDYIEES